MEIQTQNGLKTFEQETNLNHATDVALASVLEPEYGKVSKVMG